MYKDELREERKRGRRRKRRRRRRETHPPFIFVTTDGGRSSTPSSCSSFCSPTSNLSPLPVRPLLLLASVDMPCQPSEPFQPYHQPSAKKSAGMLPFYPQSSLPPTPPGLLHPCHPVKEDFLVLQSYRLGLALHLLPFFLFSLHPLLPCAYLLFLNLFPPSLRLHALLQTLLPPFSGRIRHVHVSFPERNAEVVNIGEVLSAGRDAKGLIDADFLHLMLRCEDDEVWKTLRARMKKEGEQACWDAERFGLGWLQTSTLRI
eukprot:748078-Hanusia_phi.AAC.1